MKIAFQHMSCKSHKKVDIPLLIPVSASTTKASIELACASIEAGHVKAIMGLSCVRMFKPCDLVQAGRSHELLSLEDCLDEEEAAPSQAGTATDSDDSLVPYDLTEEQTEEGTPVAVFPQL